LLGDRAIVFAVNIGCYVRHPILLFRFRQRHGRWPWPANPADYWSKVLWRKLFDRNPTFTRLSDKLQYKAWIASSYPNVRTAAVLWTGTSAGEIPVDDFVGLPTVLKSNHGSQHSLHLENLSTADSQTIRRTAERWLNHAFGKTYGEWGYYDIHRKLFVEAKIVAPSNADVMDCNCFCAMGQVVQSRIIVGMKTPDSRAAFFDREGRRLAGKSIWKTGSDTPLPDDFEVPRAFFKAASAAERISHDMDFVRLDFLIVGEDVYALECTWYPGAGYVRYSDPALPKTLNDSWDIRRSWFMTTTSHRLTETYKSALRRCL